MTQARPMIVIVEDELKIARVEAAYLEQAGYRTRLVDDGLRAVPVVRELSPALVVLDLMLPGRDGLDICRELRSFTSVPVIMVTARVEEVDRLLGLDIGADDYLCKPFSPRELVARVRAVLRRLGPVPGVVPDGPFHCDQNQMRITLHGQVLSTTATEFRLLQLLIGQPGRIWSRAQLLEQAQPGQLESYDRVIDTHIKNLRKKLAAIEPGSNYIRSVYGVGYKLELPDARPCEPGFVSKPAGGPPSGTEKL